MENKWPLRTGDKHYPVESLEKLASWRIQNRVQDDSEIFDPRKGAWFNAKEFFDALVSEIVATTTPQVEGSRVV